MYVLERLEHAGHTIEVQYDDWPIDPREWDNLGTIVCWHCHYNLGDKHNFNDPEDFQDFLKENPAVVLPVYMYDHSGITLNTTGFTCLFDSSQVGYIFVTLEKIRTEYGVKSVSQKIRKRVEGYLVGEIAEYSQYVEGDIYGFHVKDNEGNCIDACGGFYSLEDCIKQAKEAAECAERKAMPLLAQAELI